MEDDYGSNVHAELEKSVRFLESPFRLSALERFCYKGFLRNSSGPKFFVCLREVSALEDVRFREAPLYYYFGSLLMCLQKKDLQKAYRLIIKP